MYQRDISSDKTVGDLGREALWFTLHTALALVVLAGVLTGMTLTHPDPDSNMPKLVGTGLALFVPMIFGLLFSRMQRHNVARHVWISGLLLFSFVCVWVLDLPTGNGLCESCGAVEKLYRTFFDITHGSGLMAGDGLLIGTWMPLSMIGYAFGAHFGPDR